MIFTAGHSTLQPEAFLELLRGGPVDTVWDVRSYPVSHWTWFRREELERRLPEAGIAYRWVRELGGRRGRPPAHSVESPGAADADDSRWHESGFVNYQWHMTTPEFFAAVDELVGLGRRRNVAVLCAEGVWWRCHRSMIADYLVAAGEDAVHLQPQRVAHSRVVGDRLERYEPQVRAAWARHWGLTAQGFADAPRRA